MPGSGRKTVRRFAIGAIGALALMLSTMEPVSAQVRMDDPPPGEFGMTVRGVTGTGCMPGTAEVIPNSNKTAFTVAYNAYTAQASNGGVARAACLLTVAVSVPQGFTFGINQTTFRGWANLGAGATGQLNTQYWFVGQPQTGVIRRDLNGAYSDNWQATDTIGIAAVQWMDCRANYPLNINSQLIVRAGSSSGANEMTMDATDSNITTLYNLSWKRC
jgi:hypothetical protein